MRQVFGRTSVWVALSALTILLALSAAMALGQGRGQRGGGTAPGGGAVPAGAGGAAILNRACSGCHAADVVAAYRYESVDRYRELVDSMITAGAQMTVQEIPVLSEYLFATYGRKAAAGAEAQAAAPDPGKAILEAACTTCHGLDPMASHVYDTKEPYEAVVRSMVAYGAQVTDAQMGPLVEYMLKTYGKPPAAAPAPGATASASTPDPGKAILESACTTCHGLDGMANHRYDSATPYESLVKSMVAYGAVVTDAQMKPLVDYMLKTYGKK
jgi:mono/diheme cytochrome c family protein